MSEQIRRLTPADVSNLSYETAAAPMHIGTIATLDGGPLTDSAGALRLPSIKSRLGRRLALLPQLRRRLCRPGLFRGRAVWVDDPSFAIDRHVFEARVPAPGGEAELLATAERLLRPLLDRSRPPWELWLLSGLEGGRVGLVLKVHHAVTDGMGAVGLIGTLMDLEPDAPDPDPVPWSPAPAPGGWDLFVENTFGRFGGLARAARALSHPRRVGRATREVAVESWKALRDLNRAPRTSINGPISPGRELRVIRFGLAAAKEAAHARGAKVNDVFLDVAAGGLRALLAARGEQVVGIDLMASVPVSLRTAAAGAELGNLVGVVTVPLPVGEPHARRRLDLIAEQSRRAKAEQTPAHVQALMAWVAKTPLTRACIKRQRMVNIFATNVMGPPVPLYLLGARLLDAVPCIALAGNVRVTFGALSYAGTMSVLVMADAATSPDLDVLADGMRATWAELAAPAVAAAS